MPEPERSDIASSDAALLTDAVRMAAVLLSALHSTLSLEDGTRVGTAPCPPNRLKEWEAIVRAQSGVVVIPDLRDHGSAPDHEGSDHDIRFYAGAPLALSSGRRVGVLSVFDSRPRTLSEDQKSWLASLASLIAAKLERNPPSDLLTGTEGRQTQTVLLEATLATMDQGLALIDPSGRVLVANKRLAELLGLPPEFLAARPHVHEVRALQEQAGEYDATSAEFQRWIRAGELIPRERTYERTRPNGTVLEVRSVPMPDGGVVRTYSDITARRKAESALRASEALYRLLAENSTDMIVRTDLSGTRLFLSPASRELVGYEPEELVGTQLADYVHPDDRQSVVQDLDRLMKGEVERQTAVYRVRHKSGAWIWSETRRRLVRDEAGNPVEIVAVVRDVSDRKAAEDALHKSEERYRLLAENSSDIIVLKPSMGGPKYVSPAVRTVLGYDPEEFLARITADLIHPLDRARVEALYNSIGPDRPEAKSVHRLKHRDGHYVWIEVVFTWTVGPAGEPAIIATNRDVTERQEQAEELRRAKEAAEQASEAKTQFLATMSHEIRTPLNGITGFTDLILERTDLDPELQRQVELIRTSSSALLTVINDVLDFSKIEAGRVELHPEPFWPKAMMNNCASIVRELAVKKGLALTVDVGDSLPNRLLGDESRLRQVLLNLLNNAIKFTPVGSINLALKHESVSPDQDRLHFSVSDTGIGIPKSQQARLFERFSQVDSAANRQYSGTGLGLAISKQLVNLMGGSMGVESAPGHGSTFWFSIVLPRASEAPSVARHNAAAPSHSSRPARILLAEDVEINQEIARAILEKAGYAVDVVSDGAQAIKALQQRAYDLVLMDVHMPVVDGLQATRHIRVSEGDARRIPIVALTANVYTDQVAGCRAAGMDDHVGKPFQPAALLDTVDRWVRSHANMHPARAEAGPEPGLFAAAASMMGHQTAAKLMERLREQLRAFPEVEDPALVDRVQLAAKAHKLVGSAGMLGFGELASVCSELELAALRSDRIDGLLKRASALRITALEEIEQGRCHSLPSSDPRGFQETR